MTIKEKAWKTFGDYIKARDKRCVTCGSTNNPQAGHFWHAVLDFDEENINQQCMKCNHFLSGNLAVYAVYLLGKLGKEGFDNLNKRHYLALKGEKRTPEEYKAIIEKYQKLLTVA